MASSARVDHVHDHGHQSPTSPLSCVDPRCYIRVAHLPEAIGHRESADDDTQKCWTTPDPHPHNLDALQRPEVVYRLSVWKKPTLPLDPIQTHERKLSASASFMVPRPLLGRARGVQDVRISFCSYVVFT